MSTSPENVILLPQAPLIRVPPPPEDYAIYRDKVTPIVIDNGATTLRYGFAAATSPRVAPNAVSKYKERRSNKPLLVFGDGVDIESGAKSQVRTPWEGDVLLNFDALENALDYTFINLGIDTSTVEHPILMTERLSTPLHSRTLTSELLFELYSVPSAAYCVDSVMAMYQNNLPPSDKLFSESGLVVSFNTASTSVVPILNGKGIMSHSKRIPWGASQASEYLLKLVQLKYPSFPARLTTAQSNWMLQNYCSFSPDYNTLLRRLKDPLELRGSECVIQFPYALPVAEAEKTEEELARIAERKREQGKRLQELAAKNRLEKLVQKENDLQYLLDLKERKIKEGKREWLAVLKSEGFEDENSLDQTIKKLENDLKKACKKEANEGDEIEEEPSFPLIDVPDADLDEEGIKEKRKQKLMKAGYDARVRAKREKEREREEREQEVKREEEERERDLHGWAQRLRREHDALLNKIKDRTRRKVDLTDRKSAAAQARMKNIVNLAADDRGGKKRRKGGGEDMFGADDADWAIYRKINTQAASSDEEDDLNQLQEVEQKLLTFDPTFTIDHTHASLASQRSALMSAFKPDYADGDLAGKARIHLSTERWRVCEAWFAPSMAGVDSAGLGEVIQNILARFTEDEKGKLVKNVFLTGGPSQLPGLTERLHFALRPILPPEMPLEIVRAVDPLLDAWKGMAAFAQTDEFTTVGVTRAEYEEWGGERVKRWWGGNWTSSMQTQT